MKPDKSNAHPDETEIYASRMPSLESLGELSRLPDAFGSGSSREPPIPAQGFVGVSREEFERALFGLELVRPVELAAFLEGLPEGRRPSGVESLARALIEARKLSRYQASAIYQGKGKILAIGPYLVLDRLGKGGMGLVFKARHRDFLDPLALKILPPSSSKNADSVRRFHREARLLARLEHPHLVTSHGIGEHGGVHFLVMDYIKGADLDRIVRFRGPLQPSRAVEVIIQAAKGLGAAHDRRIVHRDIKPANLMVDDKGIVRVLDLGLARVVGPTGATRWEDSDRDASLTGTGIIMGTVDFLSPEQSKDSKRADHRADVYSLGCTLYFLLTGQPPYPRETLMQRLLAHHQDDIPSIRDVRPEIPPILDEAFRRMIAKHPDRRPQSMTKVVELLESCRGARHSGKILLVFDDKGSPRPDEATPSPPDLSGREAGKRMPPTWPEDSPDDSDNEMEVYDLAPTSIDNSSTRRDAMPVGYRPQDASPSEKAPEPRNWRPILMAIAALVLGAAIIAAYAGSRSRQGKIPRPEPPPPIKNQR
jgi:serine/threonine protein kinase